MGESWPQKQNDSTTEAHNWVFQWNPLKNSAQDFSFSLLRRIVLVSKLWPGVVLFLTTINNADQIYLFITSLFTAITRLIVSIYVSAAPSLPSD